MKNIQAVLSPVTEKTGTKLFDTINVKDIIGLYKKDHDVDVSEYFKDMEKVPIMECEATGYRFYHPASVAGSGIFYEQFQKKNINNDDWYRKWGYDYQFAYDRINKEEKILDIGCGTGEFLKRIREKSSRASGLELNSVAWGKCKAAGLTVYNETIQAHAEKNEGAYDVVCIFQVLEHVYEIKNFLDAALKVLKKGGKLVIGVPNNEPYFQGYDKYTSLNLPPHHMGLWNQKALRNIQPYFNIRLKEAAYDAKPSLKHAAYFRAKYWCGIKSSLHEHTLPEKIKLLLASTLSVPVSLFEYIKGKKSCGFVVAFYEK